MNSETWSIIDESFARWPESKASGVSADEFERGVAPFGPHLDPDYREFVLRYGGGIVGPNPIDGLRKAEARGNGRWRCPRRYRTH